MDTIQSLPISTVRTELRDIVDALYARATGAVIITRNGKEMAVIISYEDWLSAEPLIKAKPQANR